MNTHLPSITAPMRRRHILLAAGTLAALPALARAEWLHDDVVVYADPALRPVIAAIGRDFTLAQRVRCFCTAPAQMLALLQHGTQGDVLVTQAATMAQAHTTGAVASPTPDLWRNRLVFAVTGQPPTPADFDAPALAAAIGAGKLALPDPSDASTIDGPALLQRLSSIQTLAGRTIGAADTEDAVATLKRGEASVALCHATQVAADPSLHILMRVPDAAYDPILYAAALTRAAWSRYNAPFIAFLAAGAAPTARRLGLEVLT